MRAHLYIIGGETSLAAGAAMIAPMRAEAILLWAGIGIVLLGFFWGRWEIRRKRRTDPHGVISGLVSETGVVSWQAVFMQFWRSEWSLIPTGLAALAIAWFVVAHLDSSTAPPEEKSSLTVEEQFVQGVMGRTLTTIEREILHIKPTEAEKIALSSARALLSMLRSSGAYHRKPDIPARLLTSWGLSPKMGYERWPIVDRNIDADPSRSGLIYVVKDEFVEVVDGPAWQNYLPFILPYLEEFGMERALYETRRYNGEAERRIDK